LTAWSPTLASVASWAWRPRRSWRCSRSATRSGTWWVCSTISRQGALHGGGCGTEDLGLRL